MSFLTLPPCCTNYLISCKIRRNFFKIYSIYSDVTVYYGALKSSNTFSSRSKSDNVYAYVLYFWRSSVISCRTTTTYFSDYFFTHFTIFSSKDYAFSHNFLISSLTFKKKMAFWDYYCFCNSTFKRVHGRHYSDETNADSKCLTYILCVSESWPLDFTIRIYFCLNRQSSFNVNTNCLSLE